MNKPQKTNNPIIAIEGVEKHFGDVTALDGVSLNIQAGEFFSLLGPSGCGKTTLLRMISGFDSPSVGNVFIGGSDMTDVPPNERPTNMVFQSYAIFPHLNVAENVGYGLKKQKLPRDEMKLRVEEALALVDLEGYGARESHALSGGQRQRVALARALIMKPKVLLLDEPLSALDKKLRETMQSELRKLQRTVGITFVLVTHDQEEAMSLSDRMAIMKNGEILQVGNPVEIYEKPKDKYIANFIGTANIFNVLNKNNQIIIKELNYEVKNINNKENYVKCLIRPEKISIKKIENRSDNLNFGVVKEVAYLGSYTKYLIDVNGFEFYSFMQNTLVSDNLQIRWDDKVQISFNESSIYFFND